MKQILIAGFGGQGILFTGKFLAYAGMRQGLDVSWLPSYGPETRGGTSNCSVVLSETPIGSPVVLSPDILICMNLPSLDKYESQLAAGGWLFVDSSLVKRRAAAPIKNVRYIPATQLASDVNMDGLANMIMAGHVIRVCALCGRDTVAETLRDVVSERRREMYAANLKAIQLGMDYTPGEV